MSRLMQFVHPPKISMGMAGEETFYAPCGVCEKPDCVLVGMSVGDDDLVQVITHITGRDTKHYLAYYCEACFNSLVEEAKESE